MIEKDLSFVIDDDLFNATKQGDIEKVKRALESGVSPNALFRTGKTLGLGQQERLRLLNIAAKVFNLIQFYFFQKLILILTIFLKKISNLDSEWPTRIDKVFGREQRRHWTS